MNHNAYQREELPQSARGLLCALAGFLLSAWCLLFTARELAALAVTARVGCSMDGASFLAFCSPPGPCHGRGFGGDLGARAWSSSGCWKPTSASTGSRATVPRSSAWRSSTGPWPGSPTPSITLLRGDGCYPRVSTAARRPGRQGNPQHQQQEKHQGWLLSGLRDVLRRRRPAAGMAKLVSPSNQAVEEECGLRHTGVVLLPPLGWLPAVVSSMLRRQPVLESAAASAPAAAEPVLTAGRSVWGLGRPGWSLLQRLVRWEVVLSGAVLVALPFVLRFWARAEASHHDTLDCRNVLQTYLIAGFGWTCAVIAAVAGKPLSAVGLQAAWRVVAARSLWTWSDLGRDLNDTPGWLHASVSRWRIAATRLAVAGAAARQLVLLAAATGRGAAAVLALSSPTLDFLPASVVRVASAPLEEFGGLSLAQLGLGFGVYAWVGYYACCFLPYRMLYDEYQSYERRVAQIVKDMRNGDEPGVVLSAKLGPSFPKHLTKRMAQLPPGDDREALRLMGIVRQRSCSYTVVKAAKRFKKKDATYGVKMAPLEFGDMRYWGSDLFKLFERQERHDKAKGWKQPEVPGSGPYARNRMAYAKARRAIQVELGKTDAEMETDPVLSMQNLMRFDLDAEGGDFNIVLQEEVRPSFDRDDYQMTSPHEMLVKADSNPAGHPSALLDDLDPGGGREQDTIRSSDSVYYCSGDTAGEALEESIHASKGSSMAAAVVAPKGREMTPVAPSRNIHTSYRKDQDDGDQGRGK